MQNVYSGKNVDLLSVFNCSFMTKVDRTNDQVV